ncbi:hypothetical protein C8J57DRAFT_102734 [Mycena rebaudengoi]|nr:hypothetical protein C8J57DRAFT_102734 [Mycena rebaudengoi]
MPPDWGLSLRSGLGWILLAHPLFSISFSSSAAGAVSNPRLLAQSTQYFRFSFWRTRSLLAEPPSPFPPAFCRTSTMCAISCVGVLCWTTNLSSHRNRRV